MVHKLDVQPIDIPAAFTLLTRIPLPVDHTKTGSGLLGQLGLIVCGGGFGADLQGQSRWRWPHLAFKTGMAAAAAIGTLMLLTGALHEDGLSDCADGLGGGTTIQRRLEIMKDSRIGAFGAAALGTAILARWSGYDAVITVDWIWAFIAVGAASRLPMVLVMYWHAARTSGWIGGHGGPCHCTRRRHRNLTDALSVCGQQSACWPYPRWPLPSLPACHCATSRGADRRLHG